MINLNLEEEQITIQIVSFRGTISEYNILVCQVGSEPKGGTDLKKEYGVNVQYQCKEIEEKNRMVKTRDLFKKIRDTKGIFHAKMASIKDRNSLDLTEAEDIKKRWQKYMEELYKKDLHDPDNHDDVITNLEPDILECEVKWALESITKNKASRGDGIPAELFQILKDDAVKSAALNIPANLKNSAVAIGLEKVSFHPNHKERQCQRTFKLPHNCTHLTR